MLIYQCLIVCYSYACTGKQECPYLKFHMEMFNVHTCGGREGVNVCCGAQSLQIYLCWLHQLKAILGYRRQLHYSGSHRISLKNFTAHISLHSTNGIIAPQMYMGPWSKESQCTPCLPYPILDQRRAYLPRLPMTLAFAQVFQGVTLCCT